jgi:large subunit ribosomal protein L14e
MIFEKGRVCVKVAGREAGKFCVVVEEGEEFVTVTGPKKLTGVKRRKCNTNHLEPTQHLFSLTDGSDDEVEKVVQSSDIADKFVK